MTPFLILHKVRGEPAFDIAEKIQIGEEVGWIIPTSGHRAYPYWEYPLDNIIARYDPPMHEVGPGDWEILPDHYQVTFAPRKVRSTDREERALLESLIGPQPKLTRRFG